MCKCEKKQMEEMMKTDFPWVFHLFWLRILSSYEWVHSSHVPFLPFFFSPFWEKSTHSWEEVLVDRYFQTLTRFNEMSRVDWWITKCYFYINSPFDLSPNLGRFPPQKPPITISRSTIKDSNAKLIGIHSPHIRGIFAMEKSQVLVGFNGL